MRINEKKLLINLINKTILVKITINGETKFANFLLVLLPIVYLDTINYGIWLTLSSFIAWFSFFAAKHKKHPFLFERNVFLIGQILIKLKL